MGRRLTEVLVLNGSVLAVIWVKECVDDKVRDATFFEGVAGVLDYEESSKRRLRSSVFVSLGICRRVETRISRDMVVVGS